MLPKKLALALAAAFLLASCAAPVPEPDVGAESGAKHAWLLKFHTPESARAEFPECMANVSPEALATKHFVELRYRYVRRMRRILAELPDGAEAQVGDRLALLPRDCSSGKISLVLRVLAPAQS